MFSKTCEYGIKAVLYIARQSLRQIRTRMSDIVDQTGSPAALRERYWGLIPEGIIDSTRVPWRIRNQAGAASRNHHSDIVRAIEGDEFFDAASWGWEYVMEHFPVLAPFGGTIRKEMLRYCTSHGL